MFYIIEIQKNREGNYAHIVKTAETQNSGESMYYGTLQYAAISDLPLHTVALLNEDGILYQSRCYRHDEQ